jgi:hypothetical protein
MDQDLRTLPSEAFLRLAVERGGLDLEKVIEGLPPEVAEALRHIAAQASPPANNATRSAPTRGVTRSATDLVARSIDGPPPPTCSACNRVNQPGDRFCRTCGRPLEQPKPVTLDELTRQGRISPEQADDVRARLSFLQSSYTAGTRYSVFGRDQTRDEKPPSFAAKTIICLECGYLNPPAACQCEVCNAQLLVPSPWSEVSAGYLTALDLLRGGELDSSQIRDLLDNLRQTQAFYMAGTKYSVFG